MLKVIVLTLFVIVTTALGVTPMESRLLQSFVKPVASGTAAEYGNRLGSGTSWTLQPYPYQTGYGQQTMQQYPMLNPQLGIGTMQQPMPLQVGGGLSPMQTGRSSAYSSG